MLQVLNVGWLICLLVERKFYDFFGLTLSIYKLNMTFGRIILLIGMIIGTLLFQKTKPIFMKVILIGVLMSLSVSFFENLTLNTISFVTFGLLSLAFSIYCVVNKKWLNLLIGLFAFISFLFKLYHYPFTNELKLIMLAPLIAYLFILKNPKHHFNELSVSTILIAYELTEFL